MLIFTLTGTLAILKVYCGETNKIGFNYCQIVKVLANFWKRVNSCKAGRR